MVQRRAAATAAAAAAASRPLQSRALFDNSASAAAATHATDAQAPAGTAHSLPAGIAHSLPAAARTPGGNSGNSLAALWGEHQQSCAPSDASDASRAAGKLKGSRDEAACTPELESHELIGCRVADADMATADACRRVNGLLVSRQPSTTAPKP